MNDVAETAVAAALAVAPGDGGIPDVTIFPLGSRVLMVGDGDFVFSEALAASRQLDGAGQLVATTLDTEDEIEDRYAEARDRLARLRSMGAVVHCGVDATCLDSGASPLAGMGRFDRIAFNFPLLPGRAHPRETKTSAVHVANRMMLVKFLRTAPHLLAPDGLVLLVSKDCYPYSWWRPEAMPQWAGGELEYRAALPWQHTEYPRLYPGPCNVNKDEKVKPTDAVIFVYSRPGRALGNIGAFDMDVFGEELARQVQTLSGRELRCDMCRRHGMSQRSFEDHVAGKIHRKRLALEAIWEATWSTHEEPGSTAFTSRKRTLSPDK